jgi:hypothetical protein
MFTETVFKILNDKKNGTFDFVVGIDIMMASGC